MQVNNDNIAALPSRVTTRAGKRGQITDVDNFRSKQLVNGVTFSSLFILSCKPFCFRLTVA